MIGQAFHWANLALAFFLEPCALGALGYWGVRRGDGLVAKVALGPRPELQEKTCWRSPVRAWSVSSLPRKERFYATNRQPKHKV
jgi:hypothetical protein